MPWQTIIAIFQLILSAVGPSLKAAALAELKVLEVDEANNPIMLLIIQEAEKLVAAA